MTREKYNSEEDQNWQSYQATRNQNYFDEDPEGTWVVYQEGRFLKKGPKEEVFDWLDKNLKDGPGSLVHEIGSENKIIDMSQSFWFMRPDLN